MIYVHFGSVAAHGNGQIPDVLPSAPEEHIPQPHIGGQLGVVPRESSDIVAPYAPDIVHRVHKVAVVPEAVPASLVDLGLVNVDDFVEPVLNLGPFGIAAAGEGPYSECVRIVQVLGGGKHLAVLLKHTGALRNLLLSGESFLGNQHQGVGLRNSVRSAHTFLDVFVAGLEVVGHGIVVPEVHRLAFGAPEPYIDVCLFASGVAHLKA